MYIAVKNTSGITILKGQVVYQTGVSLPEQIPSVALASASVQATSVILGIANKNIVKNSVGTVTITGKFFPINTIGFTDKAYLSNTSGAISPVPGTIVSLVGQVLVVSISGTIFIRCQSGNNF